MEKHIKFFNKNVKPIENCPVMCLTKNKKVLTLKNTNGWLFHLDKYKIEYWTYQNNFFEDYGE